MDALGRVVGNWCLDISNLTWVVWNLQKRFAKGSMLQRESLSNEVRRLTVGLEEGSSTKSLRQADRRTGWIAETWHVRRLRLWSGTLTALANMQCINVSSSGNQTSYLALDAFFSLPCFKVSVYCATQQIANSFVCRDRTRRVGQTGYVWQRQCHFLAREGSTVHIYRFSKTGSWYCWGGL